MIKKLFDKLSENTEKQYFVENKEVSAFQYAFSKKEKSIKANGMTFFIASEEISSKEIELEKLHQKLRDNGYNSMYVKWPACIDVCIYSNEENEEKQVLLNKYTFKCDWSNYEEEFSRFKEDYFNEKESDLEL